MNRENRVEPQEHGVEPQEQVPTVERVPTMSREKSVEAQETQHERIVSTAHGLRLNPEYLKRLAVEHQEALTILEQDDGPVVETNHRVSR